MAIRGQRFHLDLLSDEERGHGRSGSLQEDQNSHLPFIRDITERPNARGPEPPSPPRLRGSHTGFPEHKKRSKVSAFKQQRSGIADVVASPDASQSSHALKNAAAAPTRKGANTVPKNRYHDTSDAAEWMRIGQENQGRLAQMPPNEIEREREELMSGLSSSLIERLLKRANIDEGRTDTGIKPRINKPEQAQSVDAEKTTTSETLGFTQDQAHAVPVTNPDAAPWNPPKDLQPAVSKNPLPVPPNIHFPLPPEGPSLDPSDPDFLENLHLKYFPHLPVDPSKLSWMAPIPTEGSPADQDSPYNPFQPSIPISSLRFDFRGRLIPPRLARQIPSTKGLHHHGLAPEAAGYTVPELAHLSRSSVAAQRCIAYQTLGRVLYRLGRGDFGAEVEELYLGLWKCLEEGRVLDTLIAEASREDGKGNRSCKVTATEAVWLWQKGGGKRLKAQ